MPTEIRGSSREIFSFPPYQGHRGLSDIFCDTPSLIRRVRKGSSDEGLLGFRSVAVIDSVLTEVRPSLGGMADIASGPAAYFAIASRPVSAKATCTAAGSPGLVLSVRI